MTEMIVPGVFGYDVHKNLTFLQDVIDQNNLTILDVMEMVRVEKIYVCVMLL